MSGEKCDISNVQGEGDKISYFVFESVQARNERTVRRLWITTIILIVLLFVTNAVWLWTFAGFDMETYDVSADGNGIANYVGEEMDGDINYGSTGAGEEDDAQDRLSGKGNEEKSENG